MLSTHIIVIVAALIFSVYRGLKRWFVQKSPLQLDNIPLRLARVLKYGVLQRKVIYKKYEGLMHILIYAGFTILMIGVFIRAVEVDFGVEVIRDYHLYRNVMNLCSISVIVGSVLAVIRRSLFRSKNLPLTKLDVVIPINLSLIVITALFRDSLNALTGSASWVIGEGSLVYPLALEIYRRGWFAAVLLHRLMWLIHVLIATFTVALIPYTKLYHMIAGGIINTFFSRLYHPSAFRHIPDIDEIVERGGTPGASNLLELTWKQRMDCDACIECARCADSCPAAESGKPLSPMDLVLTLRAAMDRGRYGDKFVPEIFEPDIIWSCVTCGACVHQCPVLVHHVEIILDMRRYLHGSGENVPSELMQVSYNIMRYGNPLAYSPVDREKFVSELVDEVGVKIADPNDEYDFIYWMGCNASYDPNARPIAKALLKVLIKAGYKVAVLPEESCCGEPARRIGDELLFKELAKSNGEMLSKYRFKSLIVNCPHCYNVFKHEYPLYGVRVNVIHHSTILDKLIRERRINVRRVRLDKVTYHDPCYLGRWNGIYREPREVIRNLLNGRFIELRRSRQNSFCCGAGGGHLFFELKRGERIGRLRMREIAEFKVNAVIVACPFCKIMLKSEAPSEIQVLDLAELVEKGIT
ncbi:hypothetical protein B6U99_02285 [Candidatus Geothermarchaeota archaeon ex4572_27]|nr:MAG: hypothetical protein B6U99_02285 [Candidatus Geothermarchaeota archaeon ex4572_27]